MNTDLFWCLRFTPTQLVEHYIEKKQRIGLVVDLTNKDNRYYDPKVTIKCIILNCDIATISLSHYSWGYSHAAEQASADYCIEI